MKVVKHFSLIIPKIYSSVFVTTGADVHYKPSDETKNDSSNSYVTASQKSSSPVPSKRVNDAASKEIPIQNTLSVSENLEDLNLDDYVSFIELFNDKSLFLEWNCFKTYNEQYKVVPLKELDKATLNDLILVFKMLTHRKEENLMKELKQLALKEKDCQNVLKLIEAWEEDDNEICFTSKIFKDEYLEDAISIFTKKSFEKLIFPQLIKFFKNIKENKKIPQSLIDHIFYELFKIEDSSYFISCQELKEFHEILGESNNGIEFFAKLSHLFYVRGSLNESEIVSIAKKFITNTTLDENIIDLMLYNLMKYSHNFNFKIYVQILESIISEFKINTSLFRPKILFKFTSHCTEFNDVDRNTLVKFVRCLRNNDMENLHSVIFEFLVEKVEMLFKCKDDMSDVIDEIIKCEDFMFNFLSQFFKFTDKRNDKKIELRCLIVERILHLLKMDNSAVRKISNLFKSDSLSESHKVYCNSVVDRILLNLPTDFNETIEILCDMNLKRTLKKYLENEIQREKTDLNHETKRFDDHIIYQIFEKYPNLKSVKKSIQKALKNDKIKQKSNKYFNDKKRKKSNSHRKRSENSRLDGCDDCFKMRCNGCSNPSCNGCGDLRCNGCSNPSCNGCGDLRCNGCSNPSCNGCGDLRCNGCSNPSCNGCGDLRCNGCSNPSCNGCGDLRCNECSNPSCNGCGDLRCNGCSNPSCNGCGDLRCNGCSNPSCNGCGDLRCNECSNPSCNGCGDLRCNGCGDLCSCKLSCNKICKESSSSESGCAKNCCCEANNDNCWNPLTCFKDCMDFCQCCCETVNPCCRKNRNSYGSSRGCCDSCGGGGSCGSCGGGGSCGSCGSC